MNASRHESNEFLPHRSVLIREICGLRICISELMELVENATRIRR